MKRRFKTKRISTASEGDLRELNSGTASAGDRAEAAAARSKRKRRKRKR